MGQKKFKQKIQKPIFKEASTEHTQKTSLNVTRNKAPFPMRTPSIQERHFTIPIMLQRLSLEEGPLYKGGTMCHKLKGIQRLLGTVDWLL